MRRAKKEIGMSFSRMAILLTVLVSAPQVACNGSSGQVIGTGGQARVGGALSSGGATISGGETGKGGGTANGGGTGTGGNPQTGGLARIGTGGAATGGAAMGGNASPDAARTGGSEVSTTGGGEVIKTGGSDATGTGGTDAAGMGGTVAGAQIFVSPTGDDANEGSLDHPLKTITAARDLADKRKTNSAPVTVYLRAGTYYLGAPVEFGPVNSGTANAPITYAAYGTEKPVISGGIKVSATWETSSGSIRVAKIDKNLKVDQLFLNGKRQILARYPNYNANSKILDGYASDCLGSGRVGMWKDPTEGPGYVRAMHPSQWGGVDFIITGKSGGSVSYKWVGDNNRFDTNDPSIGNSPHSNYRMVENIFEELDAAGEWFYRKSTGELFFYPPTGTDLSTATIELASQDELVRAVGTSATVAVKYITFKGLTFTHSYRTVFSKPYEALLKGDWAIARAGTIFMNNAENIRVDSCFFDQVGGNGVFMSGYNRNNAVVNSDFVDTGASCVAMVGLLSAVRCGAKNFADKVSCSDKEPGPKTEDYPASNLVENNTMVNLGRFEKQVAGVEMSMTRKNTVRHNTIHTMPRAGINFNDGCWGGHLIEWNWVYDVVRETSDHGPFNAWGRDRNLVWSNDPEATKFDAMDTTTVQNNRFESHDTFFGIDLDDQASNYLQTNNLLIGGGIKVQWTRYNTYVNNIIVGGGVMDVHGPWDNSHHVIKNNIVSAGSDGVTISSFLIDNLSSGIKNKIETWDYNLYYAGGQDPKISNWNQRTAFPFTWSQWKSAGLDAHSVVADPMFVDPSKGDYTVKDGSPALTLGFKNFPMTGFGVVKNP